MQAFPSRENAIQYMAAVRWGRNPRCIRCDSADHVTPQRKAGHYWCGLDRQYFNPKTDTPLEHSRVVDVRKWMLASYLLLRSRKGVSAMQLHEPVQVSLPTAWYMIHRLRLAGESRDSSMTRHDQAPGDHDKTDLIEIPDMSDFADHLEDRRYRVLHKAVQGLLNMGEVPHKRPPHTKADLERKFLMRLDRKGWATVREV